jgi:glutathione synthase/RimK-type ligase-like ATP-grasp enzyme
MPRIALATATEALGLDQDLEPLLEAFRRAGAIAEAVVWDATEVDWSAFDLVVLRSTWDYVPRLPAFLQWVDRVASATLLLNDPAVVRWNTDKHYLMDLHRAGVPVVPTRFVEPGSEASSALHAFLEDGSLSVGHSGTFHEFVIKPSVGAGSKDAVRYGREERRRAESHVARLLSEGRSVMMQPYLSSVDARGETAVLSFDGSFSHAIRKGPLLHRGAGFVEGLFAAEDITSRTPTEAELAVAEAALKAIPFSTPAYARVDLIEDPQGQPVVLELELTEPSLFFAQAPEAADRFASLLLSRL